MPAKIETLTHYPIKGLSGQNLDHVDLLAGQGFPLDRAFGFARPNSGFDPDNPQPLPKTKFVVLARDARLALLQTHFNQTSQILTIDKTDFDISTEQGREQAAKQISQHLNFNSDQQSTLYSANPHKFTDVSVVSPELMNAVSLINQDSVRAFAAMIGEPIEPERFRGNILFSGINAFEELNWLDQTLTIGEAKLRIVRRTKRCAATEVNLKTGERDLKIPQLLKQYLGHFDMGIYAVIEQGGRIKPGDKLLSS